MVSRKFKIMAILFSAKNIAAPISLPSFFFLFTYTRHMSGGMTHVAKQTNIKLSVAVALASYYLLVRTARPAIAILAWPCLRDERHWEK